MKLTPLKNFLALAAVLAVGPGVFAQSNGVPGPEDYAKFSAFITDRNIFDPGRQPHSYSSSYRPRPRIRTRPNEAPDITLVGTMSYEKGRFAFFNGNDSDLKKALPVAGKIAGFTVTEISAKGVTLESTNQSQPLELQIGDGLRQENGQWKFAVAGELPAAASSTETTTSSSGSENSTPATPASASAPNDVLKRLMELREKENQ